MDPNILDPKEKEAIYNELADTMIVGLEKGELFDTDASEVSGFILSGFQEVKEKKDLLAFLEVLAKRWDIYKPIYTKYKSEELLGKVQGELDQLTN